MYSTDPEHAALLTEVVEVHEMSIRFTPNRLKGLTKWEVSMNTLTISWPEHKDTAEINQSIREALQHLREIGAIR